MDFMCIYLCKDLWLVIFIDYNGHTFVLFAISLDSLSFLSVQPLTESTLYKLCFSRAEIFLH
jgi:hypothetical protein